VEAGILLAARTTATRLVFVGWLRLHFDQPEHRQKNNGARKTARKVALGMPPITPVSIAFWLTHFGGLQGAACTSLLNRRISVLA